MKRPFFRKSEFRPDRQGAGNWKKLWPTPRQQLGIVRWLLYGLLCLIGLLAQDVALYRLDVAGGCTDVLPCLVLMVAAMQGAEKGSVFALTASVLYFFSGSAPGFYVIALLTAVAVATAIFRQAFLRQGFWSTMLAVAMAMTAYELGLFAVNVFLKTAVIARIATALITAALSLAVAALCYPLALAIGKIGGQAWEE